MWLISKSITSVELFQCSRIDVTQKNAGRMNYRGPWIWKNRGNKQNETYICGFSRWLHWGNISASVLFRILDQ